MRLFQLKPVRSLENIKNSNSSSASPEKWTLPPPRPTLPSISTQSRFYSATHHRDTRNLLQSPQEEFFESPPEVAARKLPQLDLMNSSKPFVVAGGRSENGDPVFFLANKSQVNVVKLTPPAQCSTSRRKVRKSAKQVPDRYLDTIFFHTNFCLF